MFFNIIYSNSIFGLSNITIGVYGIIFTSIRSDIELKIKSYKGIQMI